MLGIIFPVYAYIERPDTITTVYDDTIRESRRDDLLSFGDQFSPIGSKGDKYQPAIRIPIQSLGEDFERLVQLASGDDAAGFFDLTASRKDMRRLGLIRTDGLPNIPKQTRLTEIRRGNGELIISIDTPPGLYVHEVLPRSFGLNPFGNSTNNLWFLRIRARSTSKR